MNGDTGSLNIPNYEGGSDITLTTEGTSGASTYSDGTLNVPNYATGTHGVTASLTVVTRATLSEGRLSTDTAELTIADGIITEIESR